MFGDRWAIVFPASCVLCVNTSLLEQCGTYTNSIPILTMPKRIDIAISDNCCTVKDIVSNPETVCQPRNYINYTGKSVHVVAALDPAIPLIPIIVIRPELEGF